MATETTEVKNCEFAHLLTKRIFVMCLNYFYVGTLVEVHEQSIGLADASLVYETGKWDASQWADAQRLPFAVLRIRRTHIEAYAESNK